MFSYSSAPCYYRHRTVSALRFGLPKIRIAFPLSMEVSMESPPRTVVLREQNCVSPQILGPRGSAVSHSL